MSLVSVKRTPGVATKKALAPMFVSNGIDVAGNGDQVRHKRSQAQHYVPALLWLRHISAGHKLNR